MIIKKEYKIDQYRGDKLIVVENILQENEGKMLESKQFVVESKDLLDKQTDYYIIHQIHSNYKKE